MIPPIRPRSPSPWYHLYFSITLGLNSFNVLPAFFLISFASGSTPDFYHLFPLLSFCMSRSCAFESWSFVLILYRDPRQWARKLKVCWCPLLVYEFLCSLGGARDWTQSPLTWKTSALIPNSIPAPLFLDFSSLLWLKLHETGAQEAGQYLPSQNRMAQGVTGLTRWEWTWKFMHSVIPCGLGVRETESELGVVS